VLTSDITFAEKIAADRVYLEKLFHFFKREADPPLNPLLASYVCRVLTEVISRKPDQVLIFKKKNLKNQRIEPLSLFWYFALLQIQIHFGILELVLLQIEYNSAARLLDRDGNGRN